MTVKQISVFLENKTGKLNEVVSFMAQNNINLRALSIADTEDYGIMRIITNDPDTALDLLKNEGYTVKSTEVLAVTISDKPGGLAKILSILSEAKVAVEYTYAFLSHNIGTATMIFRVDCNEKAVEALVKANVNLTDQSELF